MENVVLTSAPLSPSVSIDKLTIVCSYRPARRLSDGMYTDMRYVVDVALRSMAKCTLELEKPHERCFNDYMHQYAFAIGEHVCHISWCYVPIHGKDEPYKMRIEYNPNKGVDIPRVIYSLLNVYGVRVTKCDVAFDFRNAYRVNVRYSGQADIMTYGTSSNTTLYIAPKCDTSGRVKIYQKDVERGMDGEHIMRVEMTMMISHKDHSYEYCLRRLQTLHYYHHTEFKELSALEYLLMNCAPWDFDHALSLMNKNTRTKYRNLRNASSIQLFSSLTPEKLQNVVESLLDDACNDVFEVRPFAEVSACYNRAETFPKNRTYETPSIIIDDETLDPESVYWCFELLTRNRGMFGYDHVEREQIALWLDNYARAHQLCEYNPIYKERHALEWRPTIYNHERKIDENYSC